MLYANCHKRNFRTRLCVLGCYLGDLRGPLGALGALLDLVDPLTALGIPLGCLGGMSWVGP